MAGTEQVSCKLVAASRADGGFLDSFSYSFPSNSAMNRSTIGMPGINSRHLR